MSSISKIEWTDASWNSITGCTKISTGCAHCYAYTMARRLQAMGNPRYKNGFKVALHHDLLELPLAWKKPKRIFVNSMSDLFHEEVPDYFIQQVFEVMNKTPWHNYQVLTKRSKRLADLAPILNWTPNIWQGVTVEDNSLTYRIDHLKSVPANIRFLSLEPLISQLNQENLKDIHWIIVGGESGPGSRSMKIDWVREIRDSCIDQNIPFFFKQWGGVRKKIAGRILDDRTWDMYPQR